MGERSFLYRGLSRPGGPVPRPGLHDMTMNGMPGDQPHGQGLKNGA
ncbi:hypothetical protein [Acetobacter sp.]